MNQQLAVRLTQAQIARAMSILELCPGLELDEQLKLSTLEGETDLFEVVQQLLAANEDDEGQIAALDAQIDARSIRRERAERRIETRKRAIMSLMDTANETTIRLPEATVSLRTLKPRAQVADADALPDAFVTVATVRKPNREAIAEAFERGEQIPGVTVTNGGASLNVRRK